jgi:oligopeptide transport system permease protein
MSSDSNAKERSGSGRPHKNAAGSPRRGGWGEDTERLKSLLAEAEKIQGESLWADAWRRLKRNKGALVSLRFLGLFFAISLIAPVLPLPSPMALDLSGEPQPPSAPWTPSPRLPEHAPEGRRAAFGTPATRSIAGLFDDGWQHRTLVDVEFDADPGEATLDELQALLEEVSDRSSARYTKVNETTGVLTARFAVPYRESDRLREELGRPGLDERLERALENRVQRAAEGEATALPADGWSVLGSNHLEGIWELNVLDRGLLALRAKLFGLWQTAPLLGTDAKGRDLLSRIVWGSRISIQVSLVATLFSLLIGVTYGSFAGLVGGWVDNLMMRIVDVLFAVPFIFVVIFLITLLNEYRTDLADIGIGRMTVFYVVIGAIYWLTMARVVRGQVLSLKHQEFIEAARVVGAGTARILFVHIVPNVLSIVIVYLTLTIPAVMLFEAFLSFLGLGVEPPQVSWGLLAVDGNEAISDVKVFWWVVLFPALAMGSSLLALNVLGDGLRDALDPKLRGKD